METSIDLDRAENKEEKIKTPIVELEKSNHMVKEAIARPQEAIPVVPYSQRLKKSKLDHHFAKFLDVFKKMQTNIPIVDS